MNLLPFNFEKLDNGDYFLTNCAGYFTTLSEEALHNLADKDEVLSACDLAKLKQGFFVAKESTYDSAVGAISSGLAKKISGELAFNPCFMIVPTLQCDHSCKYCQVSRAPLGQSQFDLDEQSIPEIVGIIQKLGSAPYKIEIQGGEPLVRFDLVEKIHTEAVNLLGMENFEFVVATSLSLLDQNILSWAKANDNVCFSVSLDGDEVVHNSNRILHSGNSFDLAIKGIKIINETLGLGRVATVTTVTKSLLKSPQSIIDVHLNLGLHDMFVRPISPYGFASKNTKVEYTQSDYEVFYRTLWALLKLANESGERLVEHSAAIHATRMLNPNYSQYADLKSPSGLLLNCILFNFDGRIFGSDESRMLQRVLPSVDFSIGTVEEPEMLENELHKRIIQDSFNLVHVGCETCAFQPYCGTDPCQNISVQGEPVGDKSKSAYCGYHKNMFKFLVQEYLYDSVAKNMIDGWLHD
jgi:His-Xaa-Ser system radical SAM maturase HxsB